MNMTYSKTMRNITNQEQYLTSIEKPRGSVDLSNKYNQDSKK